MSIVIFPFWSVSKAGNLCSKNSNNEHTQYVHIFFSDDAMRKYTMVSCLTFVGSFILCHVLRL